MSSLIQKIENRIKNQQQIPDLIEKIDNIISNNSHIISQNELEQLKIEKIDLEKKIIKPNLSFAKKFDNFFYKIEDLDNTPEIQWLISGVIPSSTIGVFYGAPGTGKSSILIRYCLEILKNYDNAYIIYIDADMAISKISELGIGNIIKLYGNRFKYAGKSSDNLSFIAQNLLMQKSV